MKKLLLLIAFCFLVTSCFAEVTISKPDGTLVTPSLSGATFSASSALITTGYDILSLGTDTNIAKVVISVPSGTAYIGDSSVQPATAISLAATQAAIILDVNTLSNLYWTGPAGQSLEFFVIK